MLCRKYNTLKTSAPIHLNPLLQTIPCFPFELGQVGDLLTLLEVVVELPGKGDLKASAVGCGAVDFLAWFSTPGLGVWVVQPIGSCRPGSSVFSESF